MKRRNNFPRLVLPRRIPKEQDVSAAELERMKAEFIARGGEVERVWSMREATQSDRIMSTGQRFGPSE